MRTNVCTLNSREQSQKADNTTMGKIKKQVAEGGASGKDPPCLQPNPLNKNLILSQRTL